MSGSAPTVFILSAAQEERLVDIARHVPKPRGTGATLASLKRRGLIRWDVDHFVLTEWGHAQWNAIIRRSQSDAEPK